jgi:hypothetical protein
MGQMILKILISCGFGLFAVFRIVYPKATVDFIALGCLAGATVPWYAKWLLRKLPFGFSKVKITNSGFEVELERRKEPQADGVQGVADKSSTTPVTRANAEMTEPVLSALYRAGDSYEQARAADAQADVFTNIVVQMSDLVGHLSNDEIPQLFKAEAGSRRLVGYIRLYKIPDETFRAELIHSADHEDIVFCQWWCIQALRCLKGPFTANDRRKLRRLLNKLPQDSDRYALLSSIMGAPKKRKPDDGGMPSPPHSTSPHVLVG